MPSNTIFAALRPTVRLALTSPRMRNALLLAYLWVNISEVFRYFAFVMPMTRQAMPQLADAAPMNLAVFAIWGVWDTLLFVAVAAISWLYLERFGGGLKSTLAAGTLIWATVLCVFWLATWNMNMTNAAVPLVALPLAWVEMVVTAAIIEWGWRASRAS